MDEPTSGGGRRDRPLAPVHTELPVIAREAFASPPPAWRIVTFLNRALKSRGLIFGVAHEDGMDVVTVYDSGSTSSPTPTDRAH